MTMPIGVGIVIDDKLDSGRDGIASIVRQLEQNGFPLVKYTQLPSEKTIAQLGAVAFLLLDWNLTQLSDTDQINGVYTGESRQVSGIDEILDFIEKFHRACFAPIFIFTNEKTEDIKEKLKDRKLFFNNTKDFILIRSKRLLRTSSGKSNLVVKTVSSWLDKTPLFKMIAEWNGKLFNAQAKMFNDFYLGSHAWPEVVADSFMADNPNPTEEMRQVLLRNLAGRMNNLDFSFLANANLPRKRYPHEAIISVLEKMTIIPDDCLSAQYGCGDLFVSQDQEETLYKLNIRCDCDFIHSGKPELIMLNGREVTGSTISGAFDSEQGFKRDMNSAYLFPIDGGKCIRIQFKDFKKVKVTDLKKFKRLGRVQAPYITDIRQRHAQWLQREGFAKIPYKVIQHISSRDAPVTSTL